MSNAIYPYLFHAYPTERHSPYRGSSEGFRCVRRDCFFHPQSRQKSPSVIALPSGGTLATLQDAGSYITKLPKETQATLAWQNATHVLIQAADHGRAIEFARLGVMQALLPEGEPFYHSVKKDPVWRNHTKLVRDR